MAVKFIEALAPSFVKNLIKSWLAYSATNICFTPDGKLILGDRSEKYEEANGRAIPEPGSICLIGGFNTNPLLNMFSAIANWHLENQIGVKVKESQCSPFLPCEYDMKELEDKPLNTPDGSLYIKRVAFDRLALLTREQVSEIQLPEGGKIKRIHFVTKEELLEMYAAGKVSFPHQMNHVLDAFAWAEKGKVPSRTTWAE